MDTAASTAAGTFLSVPELARLTGFDPRAIRGQLARGAWPGVRVGAVWRVPAWVGGELLAGRDPAQATQHNGVTA